MLYQNILDEIVLKSKEIFHSALTGIYLHGSMAMGCFHPKNSDIDLLIVVNEDISDARKLEFMKMVVALNENAPRKGIELSIVKEEYCRNFIYPTPYELHFSPTHLEWFQRSQEDYICNMKGTDKDLAAHFMVTRHYGVVLFGAEIDKVFGEVPRVDYLDSIWYDIGAAQEEVLQNPVYVILNLCRAAAYVREGLVLSKLDGGQWGLCHLQQKYAPLISRAKECYQSEADTEEAEMMVVENDAVEFCRDMLQMFTEASQL